MTDLDRLDALAAAATPGPWEFVQPHTILHRLDTTTEALVPVAAIEGLFSKRHANANFIVALVNAYPDLVAAVRERDVLREAARAALDDTPKERWLGGHDWLAGVIGYYEGGTATVYPRDGQLEAAVEALQTDRAALAAPSDPVKP